MHGLLKYYSKLTETKKNRRLNDPLDTLEYSQVVIFVKYGQRVIALGKLLDECSCLFIDIPVFNQEEPDCQGQAVQGLPENATWFPLNQFDRVIHFELVNIIISYDMTDGSDSYLLSVERKTLSMMHVQNRVISIDSKKNLNFKNESRGSNCMGGENVGLLFSEPTWKALTHDMVDSLHSGDSKGSCSHFEVRWGKQPEHSSRSQNRKNPKNHGSADHAAANSKSAEDRG